MNRQQEFMTQSIAKQQEEHREVIALLTQEARKYPEGDKRRGMLIDVACIAMLHFEAEDEKAQRILEAL
jgi:hypothetical protein